MGGKARILKEIDVRFIKDEMLIALNITNISPRIPRNQISFCVLWDLELRLNMNKRDTGIILLCGIYSIILLLYSLFHLWKRRRTGLGDHSLMNKMNGIGSNVIPFRDGIDCRGDKWREGICACASLFAACRCKMGGWECCWGYGQDREGYGKIL